MARFLSGTRNDLEAPAAALVPEIADVLAALRRSEAALLVRLSGSGATAFALYPGEADALRAAEEIARAEPAWWVRACRLGGRGQPTEHAGR